MTVRDSVFGALRGVVTLAVLLAAVFFSARAAVPPVEVARAVPVRPPARGLLAVAAVAALPARAVRAGARASVLRAAAEARPAARAGRASACVDAARARDVAAVAVRPPRAVTVRDALAVLPRPAVAVFVVAARPVARLVSPSRDATPRVAVRARLAATGRSALARAVVAGFALPPRVAVAPRVVRAPAFAADARVSAARGAAFVARLAGLSVFAARAAGFAALLVARVDAVPDLPVAFARAPEAGRAPVVRRPPPRIAIGCSRFG